MMEKIKQFWITSYKTDPFAFVNEMASTILVIIGSAILTWTVLDPKPEIFIPFYWAGSIAGFIGAYRRTLPWVMVLTFWFIMLNSIALWRLFL
mgnify:FL=1|jgi:hypothetical protein